MAFHSIPIHPVDVSKTTLIMPFQIFKFVSMPFGLQWTSQECSNCFLRVLNIADSSTEEKVSQLTTT